MFLQRSLVEGNREEVVVEGIHVEGIVDPYARLNDVVFPRVEDGRRR